MVILSHRKEMPISESTITNDNVSVDDNDDNNDVDNNDNTNNDVDNDVDRPTYHSDENSGSKSGSEAEERYDEPQPLPLPLQSLTSPPIMILTSSSINNNNDNVKGCNEEEDYNGHFVPDEIAATVARSRPLPNRTTSCGTAMSALTLEGSFSNDVGDATDIPDVFDVIGGKPNSQQQQLQQQQHQHTMKLQETDKVKEDETLRNHQEYQQQQQQHTTTTISSVLPPLPPPRQFAIGKTLKNDNDAVVPIPPATTIQITQGGISGDGDGRTTHNATTGTATVTFPKDVSALTMHDYSTTGNTMPAEAAAAAARTTTISSKASSASSIVSRETLRNELLLLSTQQKDKEARYQDSSNGGSDKSKSKKKKVLTDSERRFLDQLILTGKEVEIQCAYQRLQDTSIFFLSSMSDDNDDPHEGSDPTNFILHEDDEHETPRTQKEDGIRDSNSNSNSNSNSVCSNQSMNKNTNHRPEGQSLPLVPTRPMLSRATSQGSMRRLQMLEDCRRSRRRSCSIGTEPGQLDQKQEKDSTNTSRTTHDLWKAHQSGLYLSNAASRASIQQRQLQMQRRSSIGSLIRSGKNGIHDGQGSSVGSNNTSTTATTTGMPHVPPDADDIFRQGPRQTQSKSKFNSNSNSNDTSQTLKALWTSPFQKQKGKTTAAMSYQLPPLGILSSPSPSLTRRRTFRRSQSMGVVSPTSIIQNKSLNAPPPAIPGRQSISNNDCANSTARRAKSVTFTEGTDGTPKPRGSSKKKKVNSNINRNKILQRANSDSKAMSMIIQNESTESIVNVTTTDLVKPTNTLENVAKLQRENSISSIPSLHHGQPIRQDSISSIPSLHHGHPVRQDSISSIPSLHHGHPVRQESVSSIPSLHHGRPIRQESVSSIPSLHHGHPLRQESVSSIPSLHHGHSIHDEVSIATHNTTTSNIPFQASHEVTNTWLQQQHQPVRNGNRQGTSTSQCDHQPSLGSIPHDVTFPSEDTEETFAETVDTNVTMDSTVASSSVSPSNGKPMLMRLASQNVYEGEGIEVTEIGDGPVTSLLDNQEDTTEHNEDDENEDNGVAIDNQFVFREAFQNPLMMSMDASIRTCNSWDTGISSLFYHNLSLSMQNDDYDEVFRNVMPTALPRSLSYDDQDFGQIFRNNEGMEKSSLADKQLIIDDGANDAHISEEEIPDDSSWDMTSDVGEYRTDSWNILKDEYVNGYGGGGTLDFRVLGTSADDEAAQPHVLSPPLMESLQAFLPLTKSGQNFFLKYSMVRDGASLPTFLRQSRGVQYAILALETVDGEVFGAFTGQPWRKNWNYFGSGESFLWRMRRSRLEKTHDILDQAHLESEIDVFPFTGENRFIQLCTHDRIAVGGGSPAEKKEDESSSSSAAFLKQGSNGGDGSPNTVIQPHEWGFGLAISSDMLTGTSSPCVTFHSPSLSKMHSDGSVFEILNMELWTMTPCWTVEEAEKLELGKLFLGQD